MSRNTAYKITKEINCIAKAIKNTERTNPKYQTLNNRIEHLFDKIEDTGLYYIDFVNGKYTVLDVWQWQEQKKNG